MTNGEKIQTILDIDKDCIDVHGENGTMTFTVTQDFWDSEYRDKNDLGVDYINRADVKKIAKEMYLEVANMELDISTISDCISCTASKCREVLERKLQALPSVTPQEPNTWNLEDAREDFMHDVYNTLDFLPTNEEANQIIDSFDRVTSSIKQEPRRGHWIEHPHEAGINWEYSKYECSECHVWEEDDSDYCPNCGCIMVNSQESEG